MCPHISASVVIRFGSIGDAVIAATIGFVNITLGSAIVGATRQAPVRGLTCSHVWLRYGHDAASAASREGIY